MKRQLLKLTFKVAFLILVLASCMPQTNRIVSNGIDNSESDDIPSYTSSLNNWESGGLSSFSSLSLYVDYNSSLFIKGEQIDNYIRNNNKYSPECYISEYPNSLLNRYLVMAAFPVSTYNHITNTTEYYYRIEPNNLASNIAFCQSAGLIGQLHALYPAYNIGYSTEKLCTSCTSSLMQGTNSKFYTTSGIWISTVNIGYLNLHLQAKAGTSSGTNPTCTNSNYCKALGYDCCSQDNQCINDGTLKPGATTHPDYPFAFSSETANPGSYISWPSVYNVCPVAIAPQATPTPVIDQGQLISDHLLMLQELYECTTPIHAEMSVCTITYKNITSNPVSYETLFDDRSFANIYSGDSLSYAPGITALPNDSIYEVIYGGTYLFKDRAFTIPGSFHVTGGNDSIASTDFATVSSPAYVLPTSAPNDNLKIRYRVDGSCEKVSDSLAKCYKIYTQGQNTGQVDDHYPASQTFKIPNYVNQSKSIKVEVNDEFTTKWTATWGASSEITFNTQTIHDTQTVKITFYVNTSGGLNQVMKSKNKALDEINSLCACGGPYCTLKPETKEVNGIQVIYNYKCVYPQVDVTEAPQYQEIYASAKTVPHRLFDDQGVTQPELDSTITQEGTKFEYTNGNYAKPNNKTAYIGFNEIYGSFQLGGGSAVPAKEIRVKANTTYDLYTNSGNFSSCLNCGTDYYSHLVKLFPENFFYRGGGYSPDLVTTNRSELLSQYPYRSDDLVFGRACWLPATMIPWTHRDFSDSQYQRIKRLQTQHFLFANGYQRDWFGFDYGALIGSFDGVFWFAIGNKRRIKATSNRLYLAINAYFGDLTTNNSYHITIADASLNQTFGDEISSDFHSDGAECRQSHVCSNDSDCITQLGWDYTCQNVTGIKSEWPTFDSSANELPDSPSNLRSIFSRIGSSVGGTKRCVYRGAGAPCHTDYYDRDYDDSYSYTEKPGLNGCANNFYCQPFNTSGTNNTLFNDRINRAARSVQYMNALNGDDNHTFGKGAPLIGRPYTYNGTTSVDSDVRSNLGVNRVEAICLPGRNPEAVATNNTTLEQSNSYKPDETHKGDQVVGIGMTPTGNGANDAYLNSCSSLSDHGFLHIFRTAYTADKKISDFESDAHSQVLPANALKIFITENDDVFAGEQLLDHFREDGIHQAIIQENSCLRAPGSVCHTDTDCAPSDVITRLTGQIDEGQDYMNDYELKFWQETMVCGQSEAKMVNSRPNPDYDLTKNRCCRETGLTLSIASERADYNGTNFTETLNKVNTDPTEILGATIALNSSERYSRISTVSGQDPDQYPQLIYVKENPANSPDIEELKRQYKTFSYIAENSCCSGHWVREFDNDHNGGGHLWGPNKTQQIDKDNFQCLNWSGCDDGVATCGAAFECLEDQEATSTDCSKQSRNITFSEGERVFDFMNSLELVGVPQAKIKIPSTMQNGPLCRSHPINQTIPLADIIMPETIDMTGVVLYEYEDTEPRAYFSTMYSGNLTGQIKKRFSEDEISCCIPAGDLMPVNGSASDCCTGFESNGLCALKDYSDVSLYLNRYISSGAKGLAESLFDEDTGFLKDSEIAMNLACTNRLCASDTVALGVSLSKITVPGTNDPLVENMTRNFIDRNNLDCSYSEYYDAGLRWNTNVYCVPAEMSGLSSDPSTGCEFTVRSCAAYFSE